MPASSKPHPSDDLDVENDRPTVVPAFDVEEMARRSRSSAPVRPQEPDDDAPTLIPPEGPPPGTGAPREKMDTLVDDARKKIELLERHPCEAKRIED